MSRVLLAFIAFRMNSLVLELAGQQVGRGRELWWAVISPCKKLLFLNFFSVQYEKRTFYLYLWVMLLVWLRRIEWPIVWLPQLFTC